MYRKKFINPTLEDQEYTPFFAGQDASHNPHLIDSGNVNASKLKTPLTTKVA